MKCNAKITGERISELRKKQGLKQVELARKLNVSRQIISYYETGARLPNTEDIAALAEILNTTTDYLIGLTSTASTDIDLKAVCDYTGLSEKTILTLHERSVKESSVSERQYMKLLDKIVDSETVLATAYIYQKKAAEYIDYENNRTNIIKEISVNSFGEYLIGLDTLVKKDNDMIKELKFSYYEAIESYQFFLKEYIYNCPTWYSGGEVWDLYKKMVNKIPFLEGEPNGNDNETE